MSSVTTIIVSYNTRQETLDCLASLEANPPGADHEVVVVDNASSDGTVDRIREAFPRVRVIVNATNIGFGAANNVGMRVATGDYWLLLNSDTVVQAGALPALVACLDGDARVAAAGPRLVDADGRAELSFGRMMTPWNELRQKVIGLAYRRGWGPVVAWVERATHRAAFHDWLSGACLLVRRADALAAGMFDERYFLYAEDVDFCAALRAGGRRLRFCPDAVIVHLRGRSGRARPAATERAYRTSHLRFYAKHHPAWLPWLKAYLRLRGTLPPDA